MQNAKRKAQIPARRSALVLLAAIFAALIATNTPVAEASVYVPANRLWADGVVPFEWDANLSFNNRLRVLAAMNIWTDVANITFVLRTNQTDYVLIQDAPGTAGSSSPTIGRGGGEQDLFIRQDLSDITDFGLAHELGHVLGFYHTHQRRDRASYVTWYSNRTDNTRWGNFTIASSSLAYPRNAMDYDSVMSYGRCTFSTCDDCAGNLSTCRVLEIVNPTALAEFDTAMGQRSYLTTNDARVMSYMYPRPNWRFAEAASAETIQNGTFHYPAKTFTNGMALLPTGGRLFLEPSSYGNSRGVHRKRALIQAMRPGSVMIRQ